MYMCLGLAISFYRLVSRQQENVLHKNLVHRATATCTLPVQVGEPSGVSQRILLFIRYGDYFDQAPTSEGRCGLGAG